MLNYLRIVRPINLIIIGFTVLVMPVLVNPTIVLISFEGFLVVLKAIALTLIAASGYVINDYFDQKADAINKPHEQVVGVHIAGKRAILAHVILSSFALVLSFVLGYYYQNHFYWISALLLVVGLLIYTPFFKRTIFWGNILVAAVVAILPWWALMDVAQPQKDFLIWAMVFFSFCSNWMREVIKDIQDVEGDAVGQYRSIALAKGVAPAAQLVKWSWITLLLCVILFHFMILEDQNKLALLLMVGPGVIGWFPVWIAKNPADYKRIARLMKIWMILATIGFILLFA